MTTPDDERQPIWGLWDKRLGRYVNARRFRGSMRKDGGLWCITCERWESLKGEPLAEDPAGGSMTQTPRR